jgi:hypothetical protein
MWRKERSWSCVCFVEQPFTILFMCCCSILLLLFPYYWMRLSEIVPSSVLLLLISFLCFSVLFYLRLLVVSSAFLFILNINVFSFSSCFFNIVFVYMIPFSCSNSVISLHVLSQYWWFEFSSIFNLGVIYSIADYCMIWEPFLCSLVSVRISSVNC